MLQLPHLNKFFSFAHAIHQVSGKIYLVGGPIRDLLLDRPINDYDFIVTGLTPDQLLGVLSDFGKVDAVGKAFGIFKLSAHETVYDFALPRKERSTGPGHTDFWVHADPNLPLEEDLKRRDFTMNSLAVEILDCTGKLGPLIDTSNGLKDIQNRTLRVLHELSFRDDPLRLLRAVQFAVRLGFTIDDYTKNLIRRDAPLLDHLPAERIVSEINKFLKVKNAGQGIQLLRELDLLNKIFKDCNLDKVSGELANRLNLGNPVEINWGLLLLALSSDPAVVFKICESLKTSTVGIDPTRMAHWIKSYNSAFEVDWSHGYSVRKWMSAAKIEDVEYIINLQSIVCCDGTWTREVFNNIHHPLSIGHLMINGTELGRVGCPVGPQMGNMLKYLLDCCLRDPTLNTETKLLELARERLNEKQDN